MRYIFCLIIKGKTDSIQCKKTTTEIAVRCLSKTNVRSQPY